MPWTEAQAATFIRESFRVTRADVEAARQFLLEKAPGAEHAVRDLANEWTSHARLANYPSMAPLRDDDPRPSLSLFARHISLRVALYRAVWRLIRAGIFVHHGSMSVDYGGVGDHAYWDAALPTSSGSIPLSALGCRHPEKVFRPLSDDDPNELGDGDLFLIRLEDAALHPGVESALRTTLTCIRHDLYDPAAAMLGAAMEGSWIELGESLLQFAGKASTGGPGKTIRDDSRIKRKIDAVCQLYEHGSIYERLWKKTGVTTSDLRDAAQWSHVVRESRNVLHWKQRTPPGNSYGRVATLLMQSPNHLGKLNRLGKIVAPRRKPRNVV